MKYWRLEKEYLENDIKNMTNTQLHDLILDIDLAVKDKEITKTKIFDLLISVSREFTTR